MAPIGSMWVPPANLPGATRDARPPTQRETQITTPWTLALLDPVEHGPPDGTAATMTRRSPDGTRCSAQVTSRFLPAHQPRLSPPTPLTAPGHGVPRGQPARMITPAGVPDTLGKRRDRSTPDANREYFEPTGRRPRERADEPPGGGGGREAATVSAWALYAFRTARTGSAVRILELLAP